MKNVTITVDEDVVRWAKVWAARNDSSLSRMLGETLREMMLQETSYERARNRFFSRTPSGLKSETTSYPDRASLYER